MDRTIILGAGLTGLAAGYSSGGPVFEATNESGGICCSYYVRPGKIDRLHALPPDGEAYRFETGGGHWIFGYDSSVLDFINRFAPLRRYERKSAVYFRTEDLYVDYPIQNNLRFFPYEFGTQALIEMLRPVGCFNTMKEWLYEHFGGTLCEKFFFPFHDLYTAGLYAEIEPQDTYKSPVDLKKSIIGMFSSPDSVGYNTTYSYPIDGLDRLSNAMASKVDVRYGKRVTRIDTVKKVVSFSDGSPEPYDKLICTLPLNKVLELTDFPVTEHTVPYTSVLVLNIGAVKGAKCPPYHWLYIPDAKSRFHRVGFYSNVDRTFLPSSARTQANSVSIYIERAYIGSQKPSQNEIKAYINAAICELIEWDYIKGVEVVDPTWIDVAYTWQWPNSSYAARSIRALEEQDIYMVGRYARWFFQGIVDSIRDGLYVGSCFRCD